AYFLWRSIPDERLSHLGLEGKLSNSETLASEVKRLLSDPKSERFVRSFTEQWLKLHEIDATSPDRRLYPGYDEVLRDAIVGESRQFFDEVLRRNLDWISFIKSDFAMLNGPLAEHYQLPSVEGLGLQKVALPADSNRGGILTQASVLKVTANGTNTSPVMRGMWVLENVLGRHLPPPPPNISGIEPDIREATTIREQLALHAQETSCAVCHQHIDPPGFALEIFDPVGRSRQHYSYWKAHPEHADKGWGAVAQGKPVDSSGSFPTGGRFADFIEFREAIVEDRTVFGRCLVDRLASFALGREMGFADRVEIDQILERTREQGNGFEDLIVNIVCSDLFRRP
ncbi:MAG: DUF1592 domain-containing protein, partial [Verrucomicrobiota bacterium]